MVREPYEYPQPALHTASLWRGIHLRWVDAVGAGLLAGAIFLLLEMITAVVFGAGTPFGPAQVTLHGLTGGDGLPERLNVGLVLSGLLLHFVLAVVVTVPLAILIHPWRDILLCAVVGLTMGAALFFLNEALLARMLPIWTEARYGFMIVDYAIFGMTGAIAYKRLQRRRHPETSGDKSGG